MPDSDLSRKLKFVNRSIGSKVTPFAQMLNNALAPTFAAKFITFEPILDRFTKFDFLDRLESGAEHF